MPIDFRGISSQPAGRLFRYSTVLLTTVPLLLLNFVFLYIRDGLLSKINQNLPLSWHIVSTLQHFYFIQDFIACMFMWAQKVIVSHLESKVIVGTVDVVKTVCLAVRSLISTVKPFNHLFERTVFFRHGIVVGKSNNSCDGKAEIISKLFCEFHCRKRISTISIRYELELFRELLKVLEGHPHSKNTRSDTTVVRDMETEY